MIYLLDTNTVSQWMSPQPGSIQDKIDSVIEYGNQIGISQPVYYEVIRGLLKRDARRRIAILQNKIMPLITYVQVEEADWLKAAQFWADADNKGRQLSDIDLLIAALAHRLDAVIVSSDTDFDALPVKRENWRTL
jgi:predicted nucleic acid-binding protein